MTRPPLILLAAIGLYLTTPFNASAQDAAEEAKPPAADPSPEARPPRKGDRNQEGQPGPERPPGPRGERGSGKGGPPKNEGDGPRLPWIVVHAPELDVNGDHVIEFEAELKPEIVKVFGGYDANADGIIDENELAPGGGRGRSVMGGFVRQHAVELDDDGQPGISLEEVERAFTKFFQRQDANGDGRLTADEVPTLSTVMAAPVKAPAADPVLAATPIPVSRQSSASSANRPPSVVLFLVDDLGWRDVGFTGNQEIDTPHLDRLAHEGTVFSQAYASAPNCAPTRACLMTGQYTPRHGVYTVVDDRHTPGSPHHKILAAESRAELATEAFTLAEALKAGGYATGMFGMWNLGRGSDGPVTPLGQGFEAFVQPRDLGFDKDAYFNGQGEYLTDALTAAGIGYVKKHRDAPFFLYMAYHAVHSPFDPKPELLAKYQAKAAAGSRGDVDPAYAATVEAVDANVGRLLSALEEQGIADNTLVIFTSDNGGTRNVVGELKGGKGTLYEGGIRVPAVFRGPGVAQGAVREEPVMTTDLYPTILATAGLPRPEGVILDGFDLTPVLSRTGRLERDRFFWHFPSYIGGGGPSSAIRLGDFKLIEFFESGTVELYDLAADPTESHDLAAVLPEKKQELHEALLAWRKATGAPCPTEPNPAYDPNATPPRGRDQRGKGQGNMNRQS